MENLNLLLLLIIGIGLFLFFGKQIRGAQDQEFVLLG